MQKPSAGRIVHYVSHGSPVQPDGSQAYISECRAAIVTEVYGHPDQDPLTAGLAVLNPAGLFFDRGVEHDPGRGRVEGSTSLCDGLDHAGGSWHWPARA